MKHNKFWHKHKDRWHRRRAEEASSSKEHQEAEAWHRKRRFLFFYFAASFGFMALLIVGGMAVLAFLLTRAFGGDGHLALLVWVGGCSLSFALPLLAVMLAMRAFRGITTPIADVMAAADAVAEGDLSVRVAEYGHGQFGQLTHSFNGMAEKLERSDQQRRNLMADVAHELRTPLHIIQGNLEGILDGVYEPTSEHIIATLDETHLLARLVNDLRTLSLAEAGQLPLQWERVDVCELLADVGTSFSGQMEAAGIELSLIYPNDSTEEAMALMTITADYGRLEQVLNNLMINALRHTPPAGSITLQAKPITDGVCLIVSDTGEGIHPDKLPHIFERFWRGEREKCGGGLGLAIARQVIQAHGGEIRVESQLNKGTTFTIELPSEQ